MKGEETRLSRRERRAEILASRASGAEFLRGKTLARPEKMPSRLENRKLVKLRRRILGFFTILLALSVFILIFLTQFVAKISVSGLQGEELDVKYAHAIEEYLQKQPLERMVSQLRRDALLADVQRVFPEVEAISEVGFKGLASYNFKLKMRRAVAVWTVGEKSLYVDENGIAFEQNLGAQPEIKVVDEAILSAGGGVNVAGVSFMRFIGRAIQASRETGLNISQIKIPPNTLRQVEISFDGVPYPVKFAINSSAKGQVKNLHSAMTYFERSGINPQYLDLRIEGKGYYR